MAIHIRGLLYTDFIQFLAQTPATLKALLAIIDIYIKKSTQEQGPTQPENANTKKRKGSPNQANMSIVKDPSLIKQITLDSIDYVVSSHINTDLQTIWLKWLYDHKDWSAGPSNTYQIYL